MVNDTLSDVLTRIRNGCLTKSQVVSVPLTRLSQQVCNTLQKEGFIAGVTRVSISSNVSPEGYSSQRAASFVKTLPGSFSPCPKGATRRSSPFGATCLAPKGAKGQVTAALVPASGCPEGARESEATDVPLAQRTEGMQSIFTKTRESSQNNVDLQTPDSTVTRVHSQNKFLAQQPREELLIKLKYKENGSKKQNCITNLRRISKPGLRVYTNHKQIPTVLGGLGILILSTPQGIMTDREARFRKIGGEILCSVW